MGVQGIAPTLIIMRVALGVSSFDSTVQHSQNVVSGLRFRSFADTTGTGTTSISTNAKPGTVMQLRRTADATPTGSGSGSDRESIEMKGYLATSRVSLGAGEA